MSELKELAERVVAFRDARDWKQFHTAKELAISLALEAAEVLEHFQWKSEEEIESHLRSKKDELGSELADVLYCVLLLAHDTQIDLLNAFDRKMMANEAKYPIGKVKGLNTKYSDL